MTMISVNCPTAACPTITPHVSVFATVLRFHDVWRQRQALKSLDAAALSDIGVTRLQAKAEADRTIWDAPESWRR